MSSEPKPSPPQILVALDACSVAGDFLALAAQLAALLHADLQGVFVEDVSLLRGADLPLTYELDLRSAAPRPVDALTMERALQAAGESARLLLGQIAGQASVPWTFRTTRGSVMRLTLQPDEGADVMLLGARRLSAPLAHALQTGWWPTGALPGVIFDGTPSSQRAIKLALRLSARPEHRVLVLVEDGQRDRASLKKTLAAVADHGAHRLFVVWPPLTSLPQAALLTRRLHLGLLLIGRESILLNEADLAGLLGDLSCPLGVVR